MVHPEARRAKDLIEKLLVNFLRQGKPCVRIASLMKKHFSFVVIFCVLMSSGCWSAKQKIATVPAKFNTTQLKAQIKNSQLLSHGGNLVVVPFKAGQNAAAGATLDTLALMIIKGIADDFNERGSPFVLLTGENASSADFVLEGFIENFAEKKSFSKMLPGHSASLSISVQLRKASTNELVLIYADSISNQSKSRPDELAYRLGQELGSYISQQSQKSLTQE